MKISIPPVIRKGLAFLFLLSIAIEGSSQDSEPTIDTSNWKYNGVIAINFSQVYLQNWQGGGKTSISGTSGLSLGAVYNKGKNNWDNQLNLAYGLLREENSDPTKTDDKIDFASKYGYQATKRWYYTFLAGFKTQFAEGFDTEVDDSLISDFMAPGYLSTSLGLDYIVPDKFSFLVAPTSTKTTFVLRQDLADIGAYGVDPAEYEVINDVLVKTKDGQSVRHEFGAYIKTTYNTEVMENVTLATKLELFSNYLENPQNIDVNWEVLINMKINEYLSTNINTVLIYDDDIKITDGTDAEGNPRVGPRVQFKEVLSIGISVKF